MTPSTQVLLDALRKMLDPNFDVVLARNYARSALAAYEGNAESTAFQTLGEIPTSLKDRAMAYGDYLGVIDSREHAQITCAFVRGYQEATITKRLTNALNFDEEAAHKEAMAAAYHSEAIDQTASEQGTWERFGFTQGWLAARRQENKA